MTHPAQSVIEELAVIAILQGKTRGQFIRENTSTSTAKVEYQDWSNGYTWAMNDLAVSRG